MQMEVLVANIVKQHDSPAIMCLVQVALEEHRVQVILKIIQVERDVTVTVEQVLPILMKKAAAVVLLALEVLVPLQQVKQEEVEVQRHRVHPVEIGCQVDPGVHVHLRGVMVALVMLLVVVVQVDVLMLVVMMRKVVQVPMVKCVSGSLLKTKVA